MVIITAAVAMVLVQVGRLATSGGVFSDSLFLDSDVYMWLNRVEALADGRGWFDHVEPRINPPDGHVQHWTRPIDFLLLIGGYVLRPLFGFRDGLALWGNMMSPLLLIPATWAMYRLARRLLERREALVATAVFLLHPMILLSFAWGRPDHHSLLRLGQVLFLLSFVSFFVGRPHKKWWAFGAGWIGAWAVWANVEALAFVLIGMSVLGLWWLVGRRNLVGCNIALSGGLFAGTVVAVAIERGPDFFVEYPIDTIGFSYVVLFGLTWLFWLGIGAWSKWGGERGGSWGRAVVAALLAAGVLGALALWTPSYFAGPFGEVDELYRQVRLQYIGEQLPALRWGSDPALALVGRGLMFFGILLAALAVFVRKVRDETEPLAHRWMWAMLGGMALLYALLALDTVRWSAYMPAGAAIGFGVLGGRLLDYVEGRAHEGGTNLLRPLAVGALLLGFPTVGLGLEAGAERLHQRGEVQQVSQDEVFGQPSCDLRVAARALDELDEVSSQALVALDPDRGSELLYRTDHRVLAIANHRYQPGFTLFVKAMTEFDEAAAHRRFQERGVDAVMVCEPQIWPTLKSEGKTVIERLGAGEAVDGFPPLVSPDEAGGWWIYGVSSGT